ncbi:hypothetical protein SK128_020175 [Halocaridina rubra]|uniref:Uncharacterized protein n=1 Tax=Halocaridina rubra TaxID=373956 RepID=A0AAN8WRE0_HALRR
MHYLLHLPTCPQKTGEIRKTTALVLPLVGKYWSIREKHETLVEEATKLGECASRYFEALKALPFVGVIVPEEQQLPELQPIEKLNWRKRIFMLLFLNLLTHFLIALFEKMVIVFEKFPPTPSPPTEESNDTSSERRCLPAAA